MVEIIRGTSGLTDAKVNDLAAQVVPAATFNQGYCEAWCRYEGAGLAALLRGECGEDKATVFDDIVPKFEVGDWCKEAIARHNYTTTASYNGTSPLGGLKGKGKKRIALSSTFTAYFFSVWSSILGIVMPLTWILS